MVGVRILSGEADGTTPAAALYDSVSGEMLGAIFEGADAYEQADAFAAWFSTDEFRAVYSELVGAGTVLGPDDARDDVRAYSNETLGHLRTRWHALHVTDGMLNDAKEEATTT